MSFSDRVKQCGLPLDEIVVVGSGLLDAKGFRKAADIDLVASEGLFADMKQSGEYALYVKHGEEVLMRDTIEMWLSFGSENGVPNFNELFDSSQVIEGVHYIATEKLIAWKKRRASKKDLRDIKFLETMT